MSEPTVIGGMVLGFDGYIIQITIPQLWLIQHSCPPAGRAGLKDDLIHAIGELIREWK